MFGKRLTEFEPVKQALVAYVTRAGEKLRRGQLTSRHLEVFLQNSPHATSDSAELIHYAVIALSQIYRPGFHYAKCGIMLTELVETGSTQADLFDARDSGRSNRLMQAVDSINRRMGRDCVTYAGSGIKREWLATANLKSQHYSTDRRQVVRVST